MADLYENAAASTPSLEYARGFAASEAIILTGAVVVLGVALLMLGRMFHALSTPSKTMCVMVAANLGGAIVSLVQAYYQLHILIRGRYLQGGDAFCRYSQPVARGFQAVTWWGQLLLAWATWDTIRGGKRMGPKTLAWRMYGVSFIVGALVIGGMEAQAPGEVLWGLFCVTPFMMPDENKLDVRFFSALFCDVTLALSCLLYGLSYWRLRRVGSALRNRQQQQQQQQPQIQQQQVGGTPRGADGGLILSPSFVAGQAQPQTPQTPQAQQQQQQQQDPPSTSQARRLHTASKALLQRSTLLLVAYYVPYILVHSGMAKLQMAGQTVRVNDGPQELQMSLFFLGYVFGQPVLQSLLFIYTAVIIGNNLLGSSTTSLKRGAGRKGQHGTGKGGPGQKNGARRRGRGGRRGGLPSTAKRGSQQSTPEAQEGQTHTNGPTTEADAGPHEQQQQQPPLALPPVAPGAAVGVVGPVVVLGTAPTPVAAGAGHQHAHLEAGHQHDRQWQRPFYDAQAVVTPVRARERVPVLATIYEVTFRKGRAARRMRAAVAAAGGGGPRVGTGTGGGGATTTAPGSSSRRATPTPEEASLVEENLGSEEAAQEQEQKQGAEIADEEGDYDTEAEEEEEEEEEGEEDGIRYEEEETSRASSRFDDAGRSVVFDDDDAWEGPAYDEERAQQDTRG